MPGTRGTQPYNLQGSTRPPAHNTLRHKNEHRCLSQFRQEEQGVPENTKQRDPVEGTRLNQRPERPVNPAITLPDLYHQAKHHPQGE
jgi:hypothetical protein